MKRRGNPELDVAQSRKSVLRVMISVGIAALERSVFTDYREVLPGEDGPGRWSGFGVIV